MSFLISAALLLVLAPPSAVVTRLSPEQYTVRDGCLLLERGAAEGGALGVVLIVGDQSAYWLTPRSDPARAAEFTSAPGLGVDADRSGLAAWMVRDDAAALLRPRWPRGGRIRATVDSLGPAASRVWVRAGRKQGVHSEDSWLLRVGGQPAARLDVRWLGERDAFCRCTPLTSQLAIQGGETADIWPDPESRRSGRLISAICRVETKDRSQLVWIAAPRGTAGPPQDARVDYFRNGEYRGSGSVERTDDRFLYVRTSGYGGVADVQVGDEARVRSAADIRERTFTAHVIESRTDAVLVDAGEPESIHPGIPCSAVSRDGRTIELVVKRVSGNYAEIVAAAPNGALNLDLRDEVRFGPPEPAPTVLGRVEESADGRAFSARLDAALRVAVDWHTTPLLIETTAGGGEVALLVDVRPERAFGFLLNDARLLRGGERMLVNELQDASP
ncbi:MAG: hypothetical protein HRF50_01740 [Phycisphaerae bacterium]|jgi:hypothetical protein